MKNSIILFIKIALISLLGFILITCQEEDQMIFDNDIAVEKNAAHSNISNLAPEYLLELIDEIEDMVEDELLNEGNGNALIVKIENAIKSLNKGNETVEPSQLSATVKETKINDNPNAAKGQLTAFIHQVEAFINNGSITPEEGQTLINSAETAIILTDGSFVDPRDGYEYPVVLIGDQLWMAENLRATKLNNGAEIDLVEDRIDWSNLTTPGYCWFTYGETSYTDYGPLYNFYTVEAENLCPLGWHVPSDDEWTTLIDYLGGWLVAGDKLKESGTAHWVSPNSGATNETGFTALPGGVRGGIDNGWFNNIWYDGLWWSSMEGVGRAMFANDPGAYRFYNADKASGHSVRCIKD